MSFFLHIEYLNKVLPSRNVAKFITNPGKYTGKFSGKTPWKEHYENVVRYFEKDILIDLSRYIHSNTTILLLEIAIN